MPRILAVSALALAVLLDSRAAIAQHEHPRPETTPTPVPRQPGPAGEEPNPNPMAAMEAMKPMDRWMTMLHGYAFLTENRQGGSSGDREFESQNHVMVMAMRRWAGGKLSLLGTFTLEPATIPVEGSSELFQRGETYRDVLLVDRQHPHDLFVQLAASWEKLIEPASLRLYLAPVGEPALGPVAYPHRLSASENPLAPLSHHNQDSTHITYDVITAGITASVVTLEGSVFHGAEPDENRWNIEAGGLDSYSGRITLRPLPSLAIQFSVGHLEHPEAIEPGDQTRTSASVTYEKSLPGGFLAASLIFGRNQTPEGPEWGNLLEWTWKFADKNFVYGRLESVDRDVYELRHKRQRPESVPRNRTRVDAATFGYVRNVPWLGKIESGLGGGITLYRFSDRLDSTYGAHPISFQVFYRLRFGTHHAARETMPGMEHHHGEP
ncbi:MAG TPA: hypothetical protein VGL03_00280 [Thermoanaerobaculia bacterium]